jgi:hypothetical protein
MKYGRSIKPRNSASKRNLDIQHDIAIKQGYAAWKSNLDMQYGHAAEISSMDMQDGHVTCSGSMDMQYGMSICQGYTVQHRHTMDMQDELSTSEFCK